MVKGFKDDKGKFRPTEKTSGLSTDDVTDASVSDKDKLISEQAEELKNKKLEEERQERRIDFEINSFNQSMTDFGSGDIASAVEKGDELGLSGSEVADLAREFADETGTSLSDIDPVATVYEHELQMARNKIDSVIGYDFLNDFEGDGTEIYTAGNFLATSFDYGQEAHDDLEKRIQNATPEKKKELIDDIFVKVFLEDLDIDIQG